MADMLSQEEIDALLKGTATDIEEDDTLTNDEKDALGEIGNISMGTSATTLFTLLGQKVTITTPNVSITTLDELSEEYEIPCVAVTINYREGIEGLNLLILNEKDVKIITDLMMGGDGRNVSQDLTDIHLSAIGEAMNQMIGSACTSLSEIFNKKIDILPPNAVSVDLPNKKYDNISISGDEKIVKIAFKMTVGDLIDSEIMQVIPIDFAKQLVAPLLSGSSKAVPDQSGKKEPQESKNRENLQKSRVSQESHENVAKSSSIGSNKNINDKPQNNPVNVKPLQFESFDEEDEGYNSYSDIDLIKDVPLGITVELGRTTKKISEILDFGPGTVIELDKLVGEPLDILVNGKQIAKGEVVVVDENYGIRITDIINPQKRMNNF